MDEFHDAYRQIEYIRQSLSQAQSQIGFLVGAGCPLSIRVGENEPLLPDIAGLTKEIRAALTSKVAGDPPSPYDRLHSLFEADEHADFTIEDALSMIRAMQQVVGKGSVRTFTGKELEDLDEAICKIISARMTASLPSRDNAYHDLAIWARSLERENPVHIFTTNYDMLLEEAFEDQGTPYFDGFTGSRKAFFDLNAVEDHKVMPARWTRLWKIHGSINWRAEFDDKGQMKSVIRSDTIEDGQKYLIYPSHLKYDQSRKMPYLALMDRLRAFLVARNSILVTSGYSFGDEHINEQIMSGLKSNPSAVVYAILHDPLDTPAYSRAVDCGMIAPNLVVMAKDAGIIGRKRANWRVKDSSESDSALGELLSCTEEGTDENEGHRECEMFLGNFAKLGLLLRSMYGAGAKANG